MPEAATPRMTAHGEIGGFLGLELPVYDNFPWKGGVCVNSGRNAFAHILRSLGRVRKVYLPRFTCRSLAAILQKLRIPCECYAVDRRLEIAEESAPDPQRDEYVVFTHYFGLQEPYLAELRERYRGRLIIDQSLALFSPPPKGTPCFYSPRKFAGLPDGGLAFLTQGATVPAERDVSYPTASFLLQSLESGTAAAARACEDNERRIARAPCRAMSELSSRLMRALDFETARMRRQENFAFLHEHLGRLNKLPSDMLKPCGAWCYPFWTNLFEWRNFLIENNIYIPVLWPHLLAPAHAGTLEQKLARELIPLPIDQRYTRAEMERIVEAARAFMAGE